MNLIKRVEEQELACKDFGFYWQNIDQLIDQVTSECREIKEAYDKHDRQHLQEEVGDLLQAAIGLAVFCDLDASETLKKSIDKFQKRMDGVIEFAREDGLETLEGQSFDVMMNYWNRAKNKS